MGPTRPGNPRRAFAAGRGTGGRSWAGTPHNGARPPAREEARAIHTFRVRRYQDRLYNSIYRMVDNAEAAQDVLQEAFLSAYQSLESFKGDSLFFTWLYRIAVNTAMSLKRKQRVVLSIHVGREDGGGHTE